MEPKPMALKILDVIALGLLAVATWMVFFYAPLEAVMGNVQRVFYFHVATAWVGMLGFMVAAIVGVIYLRTHDMKWDRVELASVELSLVFLLVATVTGSIWARPTWGTWWTWDPRLTTTTIMVLVYAAYLMMRSGIEEPERRARFGAVYAILGFISVPVTFFSIRIIDRTIHPVVIGASSEAAQGTFAMTEAMRLTFFFSLFVFTVIFIDLLWHRIRLGNLAEKVEQLRLRVMQ